MQSATRSPTLYASPISSGSPSFISSADESSDDTGMTDAASESTMTIGRKDGDDQEPKEAVVLVRNGRKTYGSGKSKKEVLKGINMTVTEGSIYGLLGASGCGKTTLLSCIVGLKNLDKKEGGILNVFGGRPGDPGVGIPGRRVGYMPQEYALFGEFTVRETLQYFGRIYGMRNDEIKSKTKFLIKLLDLPDEKSRQVKSFSGGQQRRVSFAASLLHTPELLILDEPTVGVDPMLRQSIWNYLMGLSTGDTKTTIIITTHYIEEARQASTVALMRGGRILAEDAPNELLKIYNSSTLEDVFLKLCCVDNQLRIEKKPLAIKTSENTENQSSNDQHSKSKSSLKNDLEQTKLQFLKGLARMKKKKTKRSSLFPKIDVNVKLDPEVARGKETIDNEASEALSVTRLRESSYSCSRASEFFSLDRLWALTVKNLIKMRRNLSMLAFLFLLPAVQVVFFCLAIGRDPYDLVIAVVNNEAPYTNISLVLQHHADFNSKTENSSLEKSFASFLDASHTWPNILINDSYFENFCPTTRECEFSHLSCRYLRELTNLTEGNIVLLKPFTTEAEAVEAVEAGRAWGVMSFSSNFSNALLDRMMQPLMATEVTKNESTIAVRLDMSNQQINYVIYRSLMFAFDKFVSNILIACSIDPDTAKMPLSIGDPIYGTMVPNFTEFMSPGIIILINFFLAVALTGESFISEKRDGLLDRSRVAGVQALEILLATILTEFIVLVGLTCITLVFILAIFEIPCHGPLGWVIALTLLQGCAGMSLGFLLSVICPSESAAMQVCIGCFYPILLLTGIMWPIEGMPYFFQAITWYLPCTCACQAMRDIMSRGWSVEGHMSVKLGLISSSVWIAIFLILSIVSIKIQQKIS